MDKQIFTKRPKTAEEFLKLLEEQSKLNRQSQIKSGYDTSSSVPYVIPGGQKINPSIDTTANRYQAKPISTGAEDVPTDSSLSIEDFLGQFTDSLSSASTPQAVAQTQDGGVVFTDGRVRYEDGTVRTGDTSAIAVATRSDGSITYSDGSVRSQVSPVNMLGDGRVSMSDGSILPASFVEQLYGVKGISIGLFGQEQDVTQEFGVVNPIEPTPGNVNLGVDLRTKNLKSKDIYFPVGAQVVQITKDDGTRFGEASGHKGYGNSVLLKLSSGEMLRLSHLSNLGELSVGQNIRPSTYIGTTGKTGNTYGEHLDVEYYNQEGKIDNPKNFSGFTKPDAFVKEYSTSQEQPQPQTPQAPRVMPQPVAQPQVSQQVEENKPDVLGATSTRPQPSLLEKAATTVRAPELGVSERSQEQGTNIYRQAVGDLVDVVSTPLKRVLPIDTGLSEFIAGGKTVNTDKNLMAAYADDGSKPETPEDYELVLARNFYGVLDDISNRLGIKNEPSTQELPQPGEGLKSLQALSPDIAGGASFRRPETASMAMSNRIGEASAPASVDFSPPQVSQQSAQVKPQAQQVSGVQPQSGQFSQNQQVQGGQVSKQSGSYGSASVSQPQKQSVGVSKAINYTPAKMPVAKSTLNYTPAKLPTPQLSSPQVSQQSAQLNQQPKQSGSTNIFSKVIGAIKTIFKR